MRFVVAMLLVGCAGSGPVTSAPGPTPSSSAATRGPAPAPAAGATPPEDPEASRWLNTFVEGQARSAKSLASVRKGPPPIFGKMDDTFPSLHGWKDGQRVSVYLVISPQHAAERGCAAPEALDGLRCSHVEGGKRNLEAPAFPDASLLQPHWTTDGNRFLGAGLWTSPELKPVLAEGMDRAITVRCELEVKGRAMIQFRLREADAWMGAAGPWDYGPLAQCRPAAFSEAPKPPMP